MVLAKPLSRSCKVAATIDGLDFNQRQKLLRLVVDEVRVKGWHVEIRLRIPLDDPPEPPKKTVSTKDRLRSLHRHERRKLSAPGCCWSRGAKTEERQRQQARQRRAADHAAHFPVALRLCKLEKAHCFCRCGGCGVVGNALALSTNP